MNLTAGMCEHVGWLEDIFFLTQTSMTPQELVIKK